MKVCAAPDCNRSPRRASADYCEMHYYRLRRNGTLTARPISKVRQLCSVPDCPNVSQTAGMCAKHSTRVRRHGDPHICIPQAEIRRSRGADNGNWTAIPTYSGMHMRLRAARGSASTYSCVDCGGDAAHWSYDHMDPEEMEHTNGNKYSSDPNRYQPRCVPCHKKMDLALLARA